MPGVVEVKVDEVAVEEEIRLSSEWRAKCDEMARRALDHARGIAPVDTGAYRDSLYAQVGQATAAGAVPGAPAMILGANDPAAIYIEYEDRSTHLTLLRTLDYLVEG